MARKRSASFGNYIYKDLIGKDDTDTEIVENVNGKIARWTEESTPSREQWMVNAAFARGQHYNLFTKSRDRLINIPAPAGRKQITDDMIGEWKLRQVANMVTATPFPQVIPSKGRDGKSVIAARYGESLLDYYRDEWDFKKRYIALCGSMVDFGNVFAFYNYVENIKRESVVAKDENDEVVYDGMEPVIESWMVGDIVEQFILPQNVALPLDPSPLEEKPWVVIMCDRTMDYMIGRYGDKAKDIEPMGNDDQDPYALYNITESKPHTTYGRLPIVRENIYLQPPGETENGRVIITSGSTLLQDDPWPYGKQTGLPMVHFHLMKESEEFYARSPVEMQIPLNKLIDLLWCIVAENAEAMGHQKTLLPEQGDIDTPSNMPEVLRYVYPFMPSIMAPAPMPEYIYASIDRAKAALRDRQFSHGASIGTSVSGVRSDAHAQNLQDQDQLPLSVADSLMASSFAQAYKIILTLAAEKLNDDRSLSYTNSKGYDTSIESFRGALLGDIQRVKVRMMNTQLRSPGAVKQDIVAWFQAGLLTNTLGAPDPMKAVKELEFAMPNSVFTDYKIHSDRAYYENEKLLRGEPVAPYQWQDHRIHLPTHDELLNSDEFMAKVESGDPLDRGVVANVMQHISATLAMYQEAMSAMAPPQEEEPEDGVNRESKSGADQGGGSSKKSGAKSTKE